MVRWETGRHPGAILKGQHTNSLVSTHPWLQQRDSSSEWSHTGKDGLCGFGERAQGTATNIPMLSPSPMSPTDAIFLGSITPLHTMSTWRNVLSNPLDFLWPHPAKLPPSAGIGQLQPPWACIADFLKRLSRNSRQTQELSDRHRQRINGVALG